MLIYHNRIGLWGVVLLEEEITSYAMGSPTALKQPSLRFPLVIFKIGPSSPLCFSLIHGNFGGDTGLRVFYHN